MGSLHSIEETLIEDIRKNRERIEKVGPGIITGGAGDDPAGIVTYTLVGAQTGLSQLWLMLLSTPMMIAIQSMAARAAIVTGKSLPEITNTFYSKKLTVVMVLILAIANILTIGADINAIAVVLHLLSGVSTIFYLIFVTALIGALVIFGTYGTVKRILMGTTLILGVYIIAAVMTHPPLMALLQNTFLPHIHLDTSWIVAALGLLGTTMSPYLLFWQASEEHEEHASVVQADIVQADTIAGMVWSNLLAYCIIITGAALLYGGADIASQDIRTLALTLAPVAGKYAFVLFCIGIIVSGFLSIPVLAGSTAYAVADTFGWREGLSEKVSDAKGFYIVFIGAMGFGALIDIIPGIDAVEALYYSQVLDGVLLPILILILYAITTNRKILGAHTATKFERIFALITFFVTSLLTILMIVQLFKGA